MAATTGIWTQHAAEEGRQNTALPAPLAGPGSGDNGSNNSTNDSATISANDFLTLLVTEMQNQDPTSQTDPNEYINQLVQVNSLEQLININQNLSTALGISNSSSASASPAGRSPGAAGAVDGLAHKVSALGQLQSTAASNATSSMVATHHAPGTQAVQGNLGVPSTKAAALRVAGALGGPRAAH